MTSNSPDVSFLDVHFTYRSLRHEIDRAISRVLESGSYIAGSEVTSFEEKFAECVGARHCVGVANGLDALTLALRAFGVTAGDEVLVPAHTFVATWLAVSQVGARPVPIDVEQDGFNLDPGLIEQAITDKTRAIIVVHLYGDPVDLDRISDIAVRHRIPIIEDAAQAHGATYKTHRIGAISSITTWSFYPGKNLGAFGDAGAITTDDSSLAETVRLLGNYGSRSKYVHETRGVNSRLDPIQAAILGVKLNYLDEWLDARRQAADTYRRRLRDLPELRIPARAEGSSWHLFVVTSPVRDRCRSYLDSKGIETGVHYPTAPHQQSAYLGDYLNVELPNTERLTQSVFSLPIGPHLDSAQVDRVCNTVEGFFGSNPSHSDTRADPGLSIVLE